jgi:hypothetical protein
MRFRRGDKKKKKEKKKKSDSNKHKPSVAKGAQTFPYPSEWLSGCSALHDSTSRCNQPYK